MTRNILRITPNKIMAAKYIKPRSNVVISKNIIPNLNTSLTESQAYAII